MTKHEFYILNDLYNGRQGRGGCTSDIDRTRALDDQTAINALTDAGLIARDTGALTGAGFAALEPYRVDNAVILAAGASTRFIPLSLEQPKGLFEVKGEKLIERQIQHRADHRGHHADLGAALRVDKRVHSDRDH